MGSGMTKINVAFAWTQDFCLRVDLFLGQHSDIGHFKDLLIRPFIGACDHGPPDLIQGQDTIEGDNKNT